MNLCYLNFGFLASPPLGLSNIHVLLIKFGTYMNLLNLVDPAYFFFAFATFFFAGAFFFATFFTAFFFATFFLAATLSPPFTFLIKSILFKYPHFFL